jgi:hypothetical protein
VIAAAAGDAGFRLSGVELAFLVAGAVLTLALILFFLVLWRRAGREGRS